MNKHQARALTMGERVRWKCGSMWRSGRVLDQSLHAEAVARGSIAVSHNNHDVSWIEPRKLHPAEGPVPERHTIDKAKEASLGPRVLDARKRFQKGRVRPSAAVHGK